MSNTNSTYYNPWIDIASYQINDAFRFKGREEDVEKFLRIIDNRTMSVLYANSGIGKTSFINAGIIPEMKAMGFLPIRVIIPDTIFESGDIAVWLYERIYSLNEENEGRTDNTYYWKSHTNEIIDGSKTSLWWLLHTFRIYENGTETTYTPLIVFDQFEEVFIKSQKRGERCGDFLEDFFGVIQDLASKVMPNYLHQKLEEKTNKEGRFISIGSIHEYKVIFSLRNEYLSDFDYWTNDKFIVTELYRNRMYLLPLTREQATRVITEQPNPENEGDCIDTINDIKDDILNKINGKKNEIEPLMLSVLCSRLYDEAISRGCKQLTKQDVESINMDTLISKFYVDIVSSVFTDSKQLHEFEALMVDKDNHRNKVKSSLILSGKFDKEYEIEKDNKIANTSFKKELEDKHIIRIEKYNNDDYVELIHDRLVEVVRERNLHWKNREINMGRRLNRMNVLSPQGRRLIDNELEFDYDIAKYKSNNRWILDDYIVFGQMMEKQVTRKHFESNDDNIHLNLTRVLDDSSLQEASIRLAFFDKNDQPVSTTDGIDCFDITFNTANQISQIIFREIVQNAAGVKSYEPAYIIGGYCGIQISYDGQREKSRTYLQWDGNKFSPTKTADGYSIIEFNDYDENGFPQKTIFKDVKGQKCIHHSGNHGFKSEYDVDGFEITRTFIDKDGDDGELVIGICKRKIEYDGIEKGFIVKETNLDNNSNPTCDKNGFCIVRFERDKLGRIIKESYYDKNDVPCLCNDGYAAELTTYIDTPNDKYSLSRYVDKNNDSVRHKDGHWITRYDYDEFNYIVSIEYNSEDNPDLISTDFVRQNRTQFLYDKKHHISGTMEYDKTGIYKEGYWFEYNKTYTHVVRMGCLSERGEKTIIPNFSNSDHLVYGIELRKDSQDKTTPLLNVFLNDKNIPIICSEGYKAIRSWDEEKTWLNKESRRVKEMYYDDMGKPMKDEDGVSGYRVEYDENNLIQKTYCIDDDGKDCNNKYGVCCTESKCDKEGRDVCRCWYNRLGERCPNENEIFGVVYQWSGDRMTKTTANTNQQGVYCEDKNGVAFEIEELEKPYSDKVIRTYKLNLKKDIIVNKDGFYITSYLYDNEGNLIGIKNIGPDGKLLMCKDGYAIKMIEISSDGLVKKTKFFDEGKKPTMPEKVGYYMSEEHKDEKGRVKRLLTYNEKLEVLELEPGSFGLYFIYDDTHNSTTTCNLNREGNVVNDAKGVAKHYIELDAKGRKIKQIDYDVDDNPIYSEDGDYGKRWEYNDSQDKKSQVEISIDENKNLTNNSYGYSIVETIFDDNNNPIKISFFDTERRPVISSNGFHSTFINIHFDGSQTKIEEISFANIYDERCNNIEGISQIVRHYNASDNLILEYRKNLNDEIVPYENQVYIKKRNYINKKEYIESYHDVHESLMEDQNGVALQHLWIDESGRPIKRVSYDSRKNVKMDELGDYGEKIIYINPNEQLYIGLNKDGNSHTNNNGYYCQHIVLDGRITYRFFLDEERNPAPDTSGIFGIKTERPCENTTITTTLGIDKKPYAPVDKGYATVEEERNEQTIRIFWRKEDGTPFVDSDGDSGFIINYFDGFLIREFLNKDGHPHINKKRRAKSVESNEDNLYKEIWLDVDNNPISNENGDYGVQILTNDAEFSRTIAYLDMEGNPHKNKEGWTYKKIFFINNTEAQEIHLYDDYMNPIEDQDGDVAYRREVDEEGSITFISLDSSGNPCINKNGYAWRKVMLDEKERIIKELWYDVNGVPFCNDKGDFGIYTQYDDSKKTRRRISLDKDGKPHVNQIGYSIFSQTFDDRGRIIQELWFDEKEQPILEKASNCYGANIYHINEQLEIRVNLGVDYRPCKDKNGCVINKIWKDSNNRRIRDMQFDLGGNPVYDKLGDCGTKYIYTDDHQQIFIISLDADGKPHINNHGYMKELRVIRDNGVKSIFIDKNENPVSPKRVFINRVLSLFKKRNDSMTTIRNIAVFHTLTENKGQLYKKGFKGDFLLIQYNRWEIGFPMEILEQEIENSRETEKDMVFIRLNKDEDGLSLGEYYQMQFTRDLLDAHFESIIIPDDVYQEAMRIVNDNVGN